MFFVHCVTFFKANMNGGMCRVSMDVKLSARNADTIMTSTVDTSSDTAVVKTLSKHVRRDRIGVNLNVPNVGASMTLIPIDHFFPKEIC